MKADDVAETLMQEILSFGMDKGTMTITIEHALMEQRNFCAKAIHDTDKNDIKNNRINVDLAAGICINAKEI